MCGSRLYSATSASNIANTSQGETLRSGLLLSNLICSYPSRVAELCEASCRSGRNSASPESSLPGENGSLALSYLTYMLRRRDKQAQESSVYYLEPVAQGTQRVIPVVAVSLCIDI
jgi:hypothetical protein